ncbi:MAG TPA: hypothetical protein PLS19_14905 [bacterium]|nr:hypothetical protein [bacterium]
MVTQNATRSTFTWPPQQLWDRTWTDDGLYKKYGLAKDDIYFIKSQIRPMEINLNEEKALAVFENYKIRRIYDEKTETWLFSVVDIIAALIQQPDYQTARKYWNKLKERLKKEGNQSVTNCHQLKMEAAGGKNT